MDVARSIAAYRERRADWHSVGAPLGLVATMGGLHAGHASLVEAAIKKGDVPVATIFLNPTQFGTSEDLSSYPATLERDLDLLEKSGAKLVLVPSVDEIYPPGFATNVQVEGFDGMLCAQARSGHFDGVTQVVAKLLNIAGADRAYFGEKDWQQICIVRKLVHDLNFPTAIVPCPTRRDRDGLALSTRNQYLSRDDRRIASRLFVEISQAAERIAGGDPTELACAIAQDNLISAGFGTVDYLECRDSETLRLAPSPGTGARVFCAAWLGEARLIDNVAIPPD